MKLPSINNKNLEKPQSASSQRPPNGLFNLEKNLFQKLNKYDEEHNIQKPKEESEYFSGSQIISKSKNEIRRDEQKKYSLQGKEDYQKMIIVDDKKDEEKIKNYRLRPMQKKNAEKNQENQENVFLTGAIEMEQEKEKSRSSSEELNKEKIQKENLEMKRMLKQFDDDDLSSINQMIEKTNDEMKQTYLGFEGLKNKITTINQSASSIGWGVKQELIDQLEEQFQDILQMQKEDLALDEYNEENKKIKNKQQKRGNSLAHNRKKQKDYE